MGKKGFEIGIDYLAHISDKAESPDEAEQRARIFKKNLSHFYSHVYAAIFGGKACPFFRTETEVALNGNDINFHPDVKKYTRNGIVYTEVKASTGRSYKFQCSSRQVGNYCYKLLEQLDAGKTKPASDYAFFLYGQRDDSGWSGMSNKQLEARLCRSTRGMFSVPLNLALFLMMISSRECRDQRSSDSSIDSQTYITPSWRVLNLLKEDGSAIEGLIKQHDSLLAIAGWSFEDFSLKNMHKEIFKSPRIRVNGRNTLQPFDVTHFCFDKSQYSDWLAHFRENHVRISEALNIPDNYVPF
jgi:hypothetical protein